MKGVIIVDRYRRTLVQKVGVTFKIYLFYSLFGLKPIPANSAVHCCSIQLNLFGIMTRILTSKL